MTGCSQRADVFRLWSPGQPVCEPAAEEVGAMTGSTLAIVLVPIVIVVALAAWLVMVFHAKNHPRVSQRGDAPDREVTGGIFQGEGRQVMPRRDAEPREASEQPRR
jgi:hypothetical protein